ncbi:hypothetical protein Aperf_G00000005922 [Anoplocephala perfoliata]
MSAYQGDVQLLEKRLQDYKSRAQEMNVGVNFSALDEERKHQERLLRELQEIEAQLSSPSLQKTSLPNLASTVGVEIEQNTKCLHYLTGISELERYISDVATHFAERSIELSDPQALHKNVFSYKTLTDNVKSCWDYVDQLAMLAQLHIKTSAEYHQFFHEANEVEAKLEKQLKLAQRRQQAASEDDQNVKEAGKIANELRLQGLCGNHNFMKHGLIDIYVDVFNLRLQPGSFDRIQEQMENMQNLWSRCIALVKRSESVTPMRLRLGGVRKGEVTLGSPYNQNEPVMVRALVSLTGPEYRIKQGEVLRLIDNQSDTHLWKVQTSSGIAEVPSLCFWMIGNDAEAMEKATVLKQQCKKTWLEIMRLTRQRLYLEYIGILNTLATKKVVCTKQKALSELITDIQNHLITPVDDDDRLKTAVENFQRNITIANDVTNEKDYVLKESDLVRLRTPLLRFQDHQTTVGLMQEETKRLNEYIENYLIEVKTEQKRIANVVEQLQRLTTESQVQLADLSSQMSTYAEGTPKRPQIMRTEIDEVYRSKSQPFEFEVSSNLKRKSGGKRGRSQTVHLLDAMVQIGREYKTVETQYQNTYTTDDSLVTPKKRKNNEPKVRKSPPVQRCVMTQIGSTGKNTFTQVNTSDSSAAEDCYVAEDMKTNVRRREPNASKKANRQGYGRSLSPVNRQPVVQINTCTQLGYMTHERSVSPIRALLQYCPNCQRREMSNGQMAIGDIYCGTERRPVTIYGSIQAETHGNRICKRVQCGYPCLTSRSNLCCQVEVYGPPMSNAEIESRFLRSYADAGTTEDIFEVEQEAFYEMQAVPPNSQLVSKRVQTGNSKTCGLADSYSQTLRRGYSPASEYTTSSTQIGTIIKDRETSPIGIDDEIVVPVEQRHVRVQAKERASPAAKVSTMDAYSMTAAPIEAIHHENVYIESARENLQAIQRANIDAAYASPQHAKIVQSYSKLDRVPETAVTSRTRERRSRYKPNRGIFEMEYPSEARVVSGSVANRSLNVGTTRLQTTSLPNLLEGENQTEEFYVQIPQVPSRIKQSALNTSVHRTNYSTFAAPEVSRRNVLVQSQSFPEIRDLEIQSEPETDLGEIQSFTTSAHRTRYTTVAAPEILRRNVRVQSQSRPEIHDHEVQLEHESGLGEIQTFNTPTQRAKYTTFAAPEILRRNVRVQSRSFPEIRDLEVQSEPETDFGEIQAFSTPAQRTRYTTFAAPKILRRNVRVQSQSVSKLRDREIQPEQETGLGEVQSGDQIIYDGFAYNRSVPSTVETSYETPRVPVRRSKIATQESRSQKQYKAQICKKVADVAIAEVSQQVETKQDIGIAEMQIRPIVESDNKKVQVHLQVAQPVKYVCLETPIRAGYDVSCDAMIQSANKSKRIQTDFFEEPIIQKAPEQPVHAAPPPPVPPIQMATTESVVQAHAKKLQFEPKMTDAACESLKPISLAIEGCQQGPEMSQKKLQVTIQIPETVRIGSGEVSPEPKTGHEKKLQVDLALPLELGHAQTIPEPEPEPIMVSVPVAQYAAPPIQYVDFQCDAPKPAVTRDESIQFEKVETMGKKLQVSPEPYESVVSSTKYSLPVNKSVETQFAPDPLEVGNSQSIWEEEPFIALKQEAIPVFSAPPVQVNDFFCDAIAPEKLETTVSQTAYENVKFEISADQAIYEEAMYEVSKTQCKPPGTKDFACDAIPPIEKKEISCDAIPPPQTLGKKLQVTPPPPDPLEVGISQSIWEEPAPIMMKQEVIPVYSAPPIQTNDFSCDAPKPALAEDFSCDAPLQAETAGKNLQVTPPPLEAITSQALYLEPKPVPLQIIASQSITEQRPLTKEFSCDTLPVVTQGKKLQVTPEPMAAAVMQAKYTPVEMSTGVSQTVEVPASEKVGKKLQVSPPSLVSNVSQTIYEEQKPTPLQVQQTQSLWVEPEPIVIKQPVPQPVVMSAPPPVTNVFSCDPIPVETQFKNTQVAPEPLVAMKSQTIYAPVQLAVSANQIIYEESKVPSYESGLAQCRPVVTKDFACDAPLSPQTVGKKLQVTPPSPDPLEVGISQSIWEEPAPIMMKQEVIPVYSAPPIQTNDFSCDAPKPALAEDFSCDAPLQAETAGKKLQVTPPPLEAITSQAHYEEPKHTPLATAFSQALYTPVEMSTGVSQTVEVPASEKVGKKLQVSPPSLVSNVSQTIYEESKPTPLQVQQTQSLWVEPEPIVIKQPVPQPVVMSAPPPVTNAFSCDPIPVETQFKNTQVAPEPLVAMKSQTIYAPVQLAVSANQIIYEESKVPSYESGLAQCRPVVTKDFACDAPLSPQTVGKKLQVTPPPPDPLEVGISQSIWEEPAPIMMKQEVIPVYSAPPIQTNDFSCDAPKPALAEDFSCDAPLQAETAGKNLQVTPPPLEAITSQALYLEPKPVSLQIIASQSIMEQRPLTKEFSCDTLPVVTQGKKLQVTPEPMAAAVMQAPYTPVEMSTGVSQTVEVPASEKVGKKLQVSPPSLVSNVSQTIYEEQKPTPLQVRQTQSLWVEPEPIVIKQPVPQPVVMSAPPPVTNAFSCDPILVETQSKELQISPESLVATTSQATYAEPKPESLQVGVTQSVWEEPAPIMMKQEVIPVYSAPPIQTSDFSCDAPQQLQTVGKKLQVVPPSMEATATQAIYEEKKPEPLVIGVSQAIFKEVKPEPLRIMLSQSHVETHADMKEFSCDPLPVTTQGKKLQSIYSEIEKIAKDLQVGPEPMAITVAQVSYVEPKISIYERHAIQVREVEGVGKKLQVTPEPMAAAIMQAPYTPVEMSTGVSQTVEVPASEKVGKKLQVSPPSLVSNVSQTIYEESKPTPLQVQQTQSLWVEPEPIVIKQPVPQPVVMSAPPPVTNAFSCDPILVETQSKELQISPESLVATTSQATYAEPKPESLQVGATQSVWEEPAPIMMKQEVIPVYSAPPIQTNDFSCDAPKPALAEDFSCDAPLQAQTAGKKLQVTPPPLEAITSQAHYEEPKRTSLATAFSQALYTPVEMSTGVSQTVEIPASEKVGKKLQVSPPSLVSNVSQTIYEESKPTPLQVRQTQSLWVEPEPIVIKQPVPQPVVMSAPPPVTNAFSCDPILVETQSKELQISPESLVATTSQATYAEPKPESLQVGVTQSVWEEPAPIMLKQVVTSVYSTPPIQTDDFFCDAPKPALAEDFSCDAPLQPQTAGKKLQVAPPPLEAAVSQAHYEEPKLAPMLTVKSQSITELPAVTKEFSCDTLPVVTQGKKLQVIPEPMAAAIMQAPYTPVEMSTGVSQTVEVPASEKVGKKLQVSPPSLVSNVSQTIYEEQKPTPLQVQQTQSLWVEPEPIVIKQPVPQPVVMSAPPPVTNAFSCDPIPVETQFKNTQVAPEPLVAMKSQTIYAPVQLAVSANQIIYEESKVPSYESGLAQCRPVVTKDFACDAPLSPQTVGKKLQVTPPPPDPLEVGISQSIWEEPAPIMMKQEVIPVYSAPPIQTNDFSCDAPKPALAEDFSCDAPLQAETAGKKLQVTPPPLEAITSQAHYEEPKHTPLATAFSQALYTPVEMSTGVSQTVEIPASEKVGKKLQVSPPSLVSNVSQTIYEESKPTPLQVRQAQSLWVEPEPIVIKQPVPQPVVMSAPPPVTNAFSCDPILVETQSKGLQISPESLVATTSQATYAEPKPESLQVGVTQSVWVEPAPIMLKQVVTPVYSAPPMRTSDFSCDAPLQAQTAGKNIQVAPPPLEAITSQALYLEPKPVSLQIIASQSIMEQRPLTKEFSCDALPVVTQGKKLQVTPEPMAAAIMQAPYTPVEMSTGVSQTVEVPASEKVGKKLQVSPPSLVSNVSQTIYEEQKPTPLQVQQTQSLWVEPEPIVIKQPVPQPVVMSAPPPVTNAFSCDPIPVETQSKELQISPESLVATTSQATYAEPKPESLQVGVSQSVWEEPAPIMLKQVVTPVYSAPPIQTDDFFCDAPKPALAEDFSCDAPLQPQTAGKKLQVAPPPLEAAVSQAHYEEPKLAPMLTVKSQSITELPAVTKEFSCDTLPVVTQGKKLQVIPEPMAAAIMQAPYTPVEMSTGVSQTVEVPASEKVGKKLQVSPPSLVSNVSQTIYEESKPTPLQVQQTQSLWVEPEPIVIKQPVPQPVVMSAPPPVTNAFSCDPILVETQSKELQISPESLVATTSQATYAEPKPESLQVGVSQSVWEEPAPIMLKQVVTPVYSAPPIQTDDFFCDAPKPALAEDFSCDAPLQPQTAGKKLQVAPPPLEAAVSQAHYEEPKLAPMLTVKSQSITELPAVTKEFSCDTLPVVTQGKKLQVIPEPMAAAIMQAPYTPVEMSTGVSQTVEVPASEKVGKKLQVSPPSLVSNVSQTIYEEQKPTPLQVQQTQSLWVEPEPIVIKQPVPQPVVMSAPPPVTNAFSCDPIPVETQFKNTQVAPEPLVAMKSQTIYAPVQLAVSANQIIYEESKVPSYESGLAQCRPVVTKDFACDAPLSPQTVGKKLQVTPPPPDPLEVGISQSIWEEPAPIMMKQEVIPVYSAPPIQTNDFSCDAPKPALAEDFSCDAPLQAETAGKKLQVTPPSLLATTSQALYVDPFDVTQVQSIYEEPEQSLFDVSRSQVNYVEPKPVPLEVGKTQSLWEETEPVIIEQPVSESLVMAAPPALMNESSCDPLPTETQGKKLQVGPVPFATAVIQSPNANMAVRSCQTICVETALPTYTTCTAQCRPVETAGKKLQVLPLPPALANTQSVYEEQPTSAYAVDHVQSRPVETHGKKLQVLPEPLTSGLSQSLWFEPKSIESEDFSCATDAPSKFNVSVDPLLVDHFGKKLQVNPEPMGIAVMQSAQPQPAKAKVQLMVMGQAHTVKEPVQVDHKELQLVPESLAAAVTQSKEVQRVGKKLQVQPMELARAPAQTVWEEPIIAKPTLSEPVVMAAPPMNKKLMETSSVQATESRPALSSVEVQSDTLNIIRPARPSLSAKEVQAESASLMRSLSQTPLIEVPTPIKPVPPVILEYAAPPLPILRETSEFAMQHEPSVRNVRIQKGVCAFDGMVNISIQHSPVEPRWSPLTPRVHTVDWAIQCSPTAMVGITQTSPLERVPSPSMPVTLSESTQTQEAPTPKIETIRKPSKESEPLFSYVRETTARVSKERRTKSHGLITYKTQVVTQPGEHAVSVPSMLHAMEPSETTLSEHYTYQQQRSTSTHIPKRYGRIRSPSMRTGSYARRMRSMDTVFEDARSKEMHIPMPRHSDGDLYSPNAYVQEVLRTQQAQAEERSMETLQRCVRAIGMDKVQALLRRIWEETEEEREIYEEINGGLYTPRAFPGRRLIDAETQYAPFRFHGAYDGTDAATQEGIPHVRWIPLPPGQFVHIESDESTELDETYDWGPYQPSWQPQRNFFEWIARTTLDFATQTEVTEEDENHYINRLLRSRALNAYASDFEMQQAGLKLNYPESGTVSVVSWKPRHLNGEDQLDVDTIGRLLRVSLVGARVPGTGEVISAADAFYRGILRVVYVDDSRGSIMPIPTAIIANAVIVEKQYPKGVGIALHSTSRKFPVECQELWNTSTLRRRTYRVNFIQKSPEERVDLSTALDEGLIDLTSGELVKISMPPSETLPEQLLEPRESTLGAGEPAAAGPQPERYSVHEAILNDILEVDLLAPETVIFPSETFIPSLSHDDESDKSDMEV